MCVIAVCLKSLPTEDELRSMECANSAGGGLAWLEDDGRVHWAKGYKAKHLLAIAKDKPLPCVFHFRLATVGGNDKMLAHPFAVSEQSELFRNGHAAAVLFHNGHETHWSLLAAAAGVDLKGPVSDSRALAAITAKNRNPAWLVKATGKFVYMDKDGPLRIGDFLDRNGILYSNLYWVNRAATTYSGGGHGWHGHTEWDGQGWSRSGKNGHYTHRTTSYENGVAKYVDTGEHTHWCTCKDCKVKEAEAAKKRAAQSRVPLTGLMGKPNANHPLGCTCIECRIDKQDALCRQHKNDCPCKECDLLWELISARATLKSGEHDPLCMCVACVARRTASNHLDVCQCDACVSNRAKKVVTDAVKTVTAAVTVVDENKTERETVAITIRHDHEAGCNCDGCMAERHTQAETMGIRVAKNGWITRLEHGEDCACNACVALNEDTPEPEPGERPSGHGDDCRCQECRRAIDRQILADQARELEKQADQHLAESGQLHQSEL